MGDFFLDFRPRPLRRTREAAEALRFMSHLQAVAIDDPGFGLALTFTGESSLWSPFRAADGTFVAVSGRVALAEEQWRRGESQDGDGGLAARALYAIYAESGVAGLESLGGNGAILLHDPGKSEFHLVTDCGGAFPAFEFESAEAPIFCSHPDILAKFSGADRSLDEVSLAEFILTSTVTPPFTYYERIKALEHGTVTTLRFRADAVHRQKSRKYFTFELSSEAERTEDELAEELAAAIRSAVRRRTLPRLGRTAVALSGGLDSRAILACIENLDQTFAFCCFNESNRELRLAEEIAEAMEVPLRRWQREFEYYGDSAELGTRVSSGMGTFANNHFLGIVEKLQMEGAQNFLTGCYCDYLFKGLPLNRQTHWLTGRESLAPFSHQFYFTRRNRDTQLARRALERSTSRVPSAIAGKSTDEALFQIEVHRTFPLCYEGDNQQRVIPQRVTGWSVPVADREVLEVYRKIPSRLKLNRSVFLKAVLRLCPERLAKIPDANTGTALTSSAVATWISSNSLRLQRTLSRKKKSVATEESWPNWQYYITHSRKLAALWNGLNPEARDLFERILGPNSVPARKEDFEAGSHFLFVTLLTLKLWFDQR